MLNYEQNFAPRSDGRCVGTMAALMERMRHMNPCLRYREGMNQNEFEKWKKELKGKLADILALPAVPQQPEPKLLSTVQRKGYRVEKWEIYPDDYSSVPFLALIPDIASKNHKVPGVLCLPGSNHSKEFLSGEEQIKHPNCMVRSWEDRNEMGKYIVESGMAAFVFDNPATGECSVMGDPSYGETQFDSRVHMTAGLLRIGQNYVGLSVFQKLCALMFIRTLPYIDRERLGISAHSLGTDPAVIIGLLCDDIKVIIRNDAITDPIRRFVSVTEEEENQMTQDIGNWHIIPGMLRYFDEADMCAAFAPRYLALTEGGGDEPVGRIKSAYLLAGAEENLRISYYPQYQSPSSRIQGEMPDHGINNEEYFMYNNIDAPDHSFRKEPALKMLRDVFKL